MRTTDAVLHGPDIDGLTLLHRRVVDIMTPDAIARTATDGVELVMSLMTRLRVRHIPVTNAGHLIGIISIGDIVRHRLEQVEREKRQVGDYITSSR